MSRSCNCDFRSGRERSAFSTGHFGVHRRRLRSAGITVSVSTIGILRISRIEVGGDLLAQRVFHLRQPELGLRHRDFGGGVLLLRVENVERRDGAQLQFPLRALQCLVGQVQRAFLHPQVLARLHHVPVGGLGVVEQAQHGCRCRSYSVLRKRLRATLIARRLTKAPRLRSSGWVKFTPNAELSAGLKFWKPLLVVDLLPQEGDVVLRAGLQRLLVVEARRLAERSHGGGAGQCVGRRGLGARVVETARWPPDRTCRTPAGSRSSAVRSSASGSGCRCCSPSPVRGNDRSDNSSFPPTTKSDSRTGGCNSTLVSGLRERLAKIRRFGK